jgi:hypothetical protein
LQSAHGQHDSKTRFPSFHLFVRICSFLQRDLLDHRGDAAEHAEPECCVASSGVARQRACELAAPECEIHIRDFDRLGPDAEYDRDTAGAQALKVAVAVLPPEAVIRMTLAPPSACRAWARFDGTVLNALQQTETTLDAYVREIERNRELQQARDSAAEATDQARTLLRFGPTGVLDVLNVEASLAATETALASSDAAISNAQVNVFLALGGGWES